jgi:Reverse transcriptase (RNA-dependent DNA polymerase)
VQLLGSRKLEDVRQALFHVIGKCRAESFVVQALLTDGEGAISKLTDELQLMGIKVNPSGAGSHVPVVENKIKVVKERVRGHLAVSPFKLCISLLVWLVYFCVSRLNLVPTSTMSSENVAPREAFNGTKIDYKRDLGLKFGQYCEVHEQLFVTNTMAPRTRPAIALLPKGNKQGSWQFMALDTFRVIVRDHWTKLPMPEWIIRKLNEKAAANKKLVPDDPLFSLGKAEITLENSGVDGTLLPRGNFKQVVPTDGVTEFEPLGVTVEDIEQPFANSAPVEVTTQEPIDRVMMHEGVTFADDVGNGEPVKISTAVLSEPTSSMFSEHEPKNENYVNEVFSDGATTIMEAAVQEPERAGRGGRAVRRDYRRDATMLESGSRKWAWQLTVNKALDKFGKHAVKSLCAELQQMHNKRVWEPVSVKTLSISERKSVIRSSMFLKEKFSSTGEFQKLKARLVAGGHMQDRSIYSENDTEAPTASLQSVYMIASIAAHEGRNVVTADITGAYLNADMKKSVYMRLEPKLAETLAALEPSYQEYINTDGTLVVKLLKALYGCVESARLWYDNISTLLKSIGFVQNLRDRCVFNMVVREAQVTVCIYVDDLIITCTKPDVIDEVLTKLSEEYVDITVHRGDIHSYLGQTFDFSIGGKVKITMSGYVDDLLAEYEVEGCASTPATEKLFAINVDSTCLDQDRSEQYHSRVAKLLYLAKRVRPDILTAIAFLSTRVQAPTEDDWTKLQRLLKYINGTKDLGICLEAGAGIVVLAYVDASFAVHGDMKSHTGGMISLGKGPVYVRSSKQKLTSKSSTEAELIGVSDMLPQIVWTREFLEQQGYQCDPAKIYQDNQSTIVLANKGFSTSDKTRHIAIRYFFVKDRIDAGEVVVEYLPTEDMLADMMTKPLQGSLFRKLRGMLMNWE